MSTGKADGTKRPGLYSASRKVAERHRDRFLTMVCRNWSRPCEVTLAEAYRNACRAWRQVYGDSVPATVRQVRYCFRKLFGNDRREARLHMRGPSLPEDLQVALREAVVSGRSHWQTYLAWSREHGVNVPRRRVDLWVKLNCYPREAKV